jgi:hypothetical protein
MPAWGGFELLTNEATWTLSTSLAPATQFLVKLKDSFVDVEGNALDGEWKNPVSIFTTNTVQSEFPSGDNVAGGDFKFVFTSIMPNADSDPMYRNFVENSDLTALLNSWGQTSITPFSAGDFTGDGNVDNSDLTLLLNTWGDVLQSLLIIRDTNGDWKVTQSDLTDFDGDDHTDATDQAILDVQKDLVDLSDSLAL